MTAGTEQGKATPPPFLHEMMWSEHKKRLRRILESKAENGKWSLDRSEKDDIRKRTHSGRVFRLVNESSKRHLSLVSDEHKHQYRSLFVLKLKGNCCAKPLILQLPFNEARTTEMQRVMMAAWHDLPQTNALSLNNLCSSDKTEHFCQIRSARQRQ